jgi:lysophospholipase L1-like esterase
VHLLVVAPFVLAVAAAVLLTTGGPSGVAPAQAAPAAIAQLAGQPLVAFLGDSWTAGTGADGRRGYVVRAAEQLGWGYANLGVGGSGYSRPGPHHSRFAQRIPQLAELHPDVVVVQGSLNERRSTPAALRAAAQSTLADLRTVLDPGTPVLVVGASYNPGTADAAIDWINAEVAQAAAAAGLPFVDPAPANWTDPHDPAVWADTIHPNDLGHQQVADHLVPLLRELVHGRGPAGAPATVRGCPRGNTPPSSPQTMPSHSAPASASSSPADSRNASRVTSAPC